MTLLILILLTTACIAFLIKGFIDNSNSMTGISLCILVLVGLVGWTVLECFNGELKTRRLEDKLDLVHLPLHLRICIKVILS